MCLPRNIDICTNHHFFFVLYNHQNLDKIFHNLYTIPRNKKIQYNFSSPKIPWNCTTKHYISNNVFTEKLTKCGSSRTGNIILIVTVTSGLWLLSSGRFGFGPTEWPEGGFTASSRFWSLFVAWSRPPSTRHYSGLKYKEKKS